MEHVVILLGTEETRTNQNAGTCRSFMNTTSPMKFCSSLYILKDSKKCRAIIIVSATTTTLSTNLPWSVKRVESRNNINYRVMEYINHTLYKLLSCMKCWYLFTVNLSIITGSTEFCRCLSLACNTPACWNWDFCCSLTANSWAKL